MKSIPLSEEPELFPTHTVTESLFLLHGIIYLDCRNHYNPKVLQPIQKQAYVLGVYGIKPDRIAGGCFHRQTQQLHSDSCPKTAGLSGGTAHSSLYFLGHVRLMLAKYVGPQFHSID